MNHPPGLLVDATNFEAFAPAIVQRLHAAQLTGLDIETADPRKHQGLVDMSVGKKIVFDVNRTDLCGLSLYPQGSDASFYLNIGHKDVANRLPWEKVQNLLDERPAGARWIVHNATFERTMLEKTVGYVLTNYIDSMQMAVSAYGPDEYPQDKFYGADLGEIAKLIPAIASAFATYDPQDRDLTSEQGDLLSKVIAKESDAAHSYNGWVKGLTWGYGLKQIVERVFDFKMTTFEEVIAGRAGMHELTGAETAAYGADDAYWAVKVYEWLLDFMLSTNPKGVSTYFEQELPMIEVYSETWRNGLRIDPVAVERRRAQERLNYATILRRMKAAVRQLLPFDVHPHAELLKRESWYQKNWQKYRASIVMWAESPDHEDAFRQAYQVRGAVSNAWADDLGQPESKAVNLGHYMPMRVLIYDLLKREKVILDKGKVQSDGECRGKILQRLDKDTPHAEVIRSLNDIGSVEQRMKLYLTPYTKLVDPSTGYLYPVLSSLLASRRMAMRDPNAMQLQKRGDSTYVRGFFKPDGPFTTPPRELAA